ncbi:unnamed protein product [Eruca vesicaria subsp. sativa]|uniref:Uncharacterized protein n=1 Tax=Eruca vesicaria subsp. sativa TaxID=29727 RepID=A0ABC8KJ29_ERUVS|nr:unnamed protein product [Eruca vesicaria subsp. sativa]
MGCLIAPVMKLRSLSSAGSRRFAYRNLTDEDMEDSVIRVVVGKEKKEFLVEPYVLEETPFRVLIGSAKDRAKRRLNRSGRVVWLDHVDSILFEHLLWLLRNDTSTFLDIDVVEIIEFYAQDC